MNKFVKLIPMLALVLGASLAFTQAGDLDPEFAQDPDNPAIWYDLSAVTPGPNTFECDEVEDICTRVLPSSSATMKRSGEFIKNGNLPVVEP